MLDSAGFPLSAISAGARTRMHEDGVEIATASRSDSGIGAALQLGTYWGKSGWARVVRRDWAVPKMLPLAQLPDAYVVMQPLDQHADVVF